MLLHPSGSRTRRRESAANHDSVLKGNYRMQSSEPDNKKVVRENQ